MRSRKASSTTTARRNWKRSSPKSRVLALIQQVHEVPAGTAIRLDYLPGRGTHVRIGQRDLGVIPGERFNRALLKIWLGDNPIQLSLKKALLGQDSPAL